jgi:hypothetical protein
VDRHVLKQNLDSGMICTPYVPSQGQLLDILARGLSSPTFERKVSRLAMENAYSPA